MVVDGYSTLLSEIPLVGGTAQRLVGPAGLRNDVLGQQLVSLRARAIEQGAGSPALPGVLDHLRHVQWHYSIETDIADLSVYGPWARGAQALLVVDDKIVNPAGQVLIGDGAEAGAVPVHHESLARSERVRRALTAHDVHVPAGAIPVRSTEEILLRRPDQIAKRAVALVVSADFALSVLDGEPLDSEYMERIFPRSLAERTPTELALFRDRDPAVATRLKWGYEAAAQLLAMCGQVAPTFPRDFADQGQVWNASIGIEEPELLRTLELLPVAEVCEAWETARALHHTVSVARAEGERPPAELDPEIVHQRYRAMEWITGDQPWDEVEDDVPSWA
ncbi:DUF4272 domain-containing protein [Granulicoccus sp. GXG6511]|uniref:DUF4272 domain-containing protein n=1 Tax=Granulicoccus sp. GXG6511 TaxID=3381351 RepID=UPI003D7F0592